MSGARAIGASGRNTALDGLRGLAVLLVMGFHLPYGRSELATGALRGGFLGVDVFFVLSGYLITTILLGSPGLSASTLTDFYERRIRRLVPALLVLTAGSVAMTVATANGDQILSILNEVPGTIGYWSNVAAATLADPKTTILAHTWSLSLEVQYYLIWPVVLLVLRRRLGPLGLLLLAALGVQAVAAWRAVLVADGASLFRVYFAPDARFDALLVGSALALLLAWQPHPWSRAVRAGADAVGLMALATLLVLATHLRLESAGLYERGGLTAIALTAAALVGALVVVPDGVCASVFRLRPLVAVGRISYSLYLWHWPVIFVTAPLAAEWSFATLTAARVGASFALATVSYLAIERLALRRPAAPAPVRSRLQVLVAAAP